MIASPEIYWLVNIRASAEGVELAVSRSNLASVRLRAGAVVAARSNLRIGFGEHASLSPKVLVVGKIGANDVEARSVKWLEMIDQVNRSGGTVVCDYTDHHLGFDSLMSDFYRRAFSKSHLIVVPSRAMHDLVSPLCNLPILIIPDAVEVEVAPPSRLRGDSSRSLVWFGHGSNLGYLLDWLSEFEFAATPNDLILRILVDPHSVDGLRKSRIVSKSPIRVLVGTWSVGAMAEAARVSDLCVIPSDPTDPRKRGVSSNRLLTALALGLPVGADKIASYQDFREYFTDLRSEAFNDLLRCPSLGHPAVLAAQRELLPSFSMSAVGNQWLRFLAEAHALRAR